MKFLMVIYLFSCYLFYACLLSSYTTSNIEIFQLEIVIWSIIVFSNHCHQFQIDQFSTQGKSTTHALVYNIFSALDRGEINAKVFFADVSKGFDLVDHKVILCEV